MAMTPFEWDSAKDAENQRKHGVSFAEAQFAFADAKRSHSEDLDHSAKEGRYFCFGRVDRGVLTSLTEAVSSGSLAPDSGAKGKPSMTAKTKYTSEPIGEVRVVHDLLPAPDQLAFRDEGVKVTIALSRRSVEFFKSHAAKNQTQYQRMIRQLLDAYVDAHARPLTTRSSGPGKVVGRSGALKK